MSKKNPLAAEISLIGQASAPDHFLGSVDFKILHREGQTGLISGALLNKAGRRIGQVSIDGFPLSALPDAKGPGRPRADEKHMAALLAWALRCAELGEKKGESDDQIAAEFKYSGGDKIRKIRNPLAAAIGLDLEKDLHCIIDDSTAGEGPPACSILIKRPTVYETPDGGLEILGYGALAWESGMGERVASLPAVRIVLGEFEPGDGLAELKARRGPKIISIIRPGR
ncbi:hypothetical protein [Dechloromonas sp. H13]|uniref:hypothetical protein n=1 Tax=Dechloromonas sp. H13 TaxID=2570193 RepID=UPI001290AA7B|nr:hypothetical protein [Dechloromonas sp. H13]